MDKAHEAHKHDDEASSLLVLFIGIHLVQSHVQGDEALILQAHEQQDEANSWFIVNSLYSSHVHGDGAYEAHEHHGGASSWLIVNSFN